jgi:hypothetical protein
MNFKIAVRVVILSAIVIGLLLPSGIGGCGGGAPVLVVLGDINGDGKAEFFATAGRWLAGDQTGRAYLFYGGDIASGGAGNAAATITGENAGDRLYASKAEDINGDGYADLICKSRSIADRTGRSYFFYGGEGKAPISGALNAADADFTLSGVAPEDDFMYRDVADINGDGNEDIVAEAVGCDEKRGCVYFFFGPNYETGSSSDADITITGEQPGDRLGVGIRFGDLRDNSSVDVAISSWDHDNIRGRAYIFWGDGLSSGSAANADVIIDGENEGDEFAIVRVGDLNGDGIDDIVGASYINDNERGRVYVFYGSSLASGGAGNADVIIDGENEGDLFGWTVRVNDVNGDGVADLLVSTDFYDNERGRIYGFFGGASLSSRSADQADFILTGENEMDGFEIGEVGDVSGDGIDDIVAAAENYPGDLSIGQGYVFLGGSSISSRGAADADVILTGENEGDDFAIEELFDVNGDGALDIYAGAPGYQGSVTFFGRAYLFYGGEDLTSKGAGSADIIIDGENEGDRLGT